MAWTCVDNEWATEFRADWPHGRYWLYGPSELNPGDRWAVYYQSSKKGSPRRWLGAFSTQKFALKRAAEHVARVAR